MQSEDTLSKFTSDDLPELHDAANSASLTAQNYHLGITRSYLFLLIIGSTLTVYYDKIENSEIYAIIIFLATLSLSILQILRRYDRIWYNGRALAESIKTRTWRYIMKCEPYNTGDDDLDGGLFRSELQQILKDNKDLGPHLIAVNGLKDTITIPMNEVRNMSLDQRMKVYRQDRIDDQRIWYSKKAKYNKTRGNLWFCFLVMTHIIIIISLVLKIKYPKIILPADIFIVIASGIVTWTQVKRYNDLSTAYTLTAREIGIIKEDSGRVKTENEFSDFVKDSENAFSREHTQWAARKDN